MPTSLQELSREAAEVVATASASVAGVGRSGSGVVFADGLVITNAHNLRDDLTVYFADGSSSTARVAGVDVDGDLAVLSVSTGGHPAIGWREEGPLLGEVVIGLSRPGGRALRSGLGFVSALEVAFAGPEGGTITGALEHSAQLARGSSGGPLVDASGRLAGINTHREGEGFYLALPASADLKSRVEALAKGNAPRRTRLGVALTPPRAARHLRRAVGLPPRDGLLVHAVGDATPAARAGIRPGDLIVGIGGQPVASLEDLSRALRAAGEAGSAQLSVLRGVDEVTVLVHFDEPGPVEQGTA